MIMVAVVRRRASLLAAAGSLSRRPATPITPAVPEPAGATPMFTVGEEIVQAMTANEPQRLPDDLVALLKKRGQSQKL
jgi:hypothetical protein